MDKVNHILKKLISITFILICSYSANAAESKYTCSIKNVLRLNETGSFVTHGWAANYLNRNFFVDRVTGKVTGTTALKIRLSNYNTTYQPQLMKYSDINKSYKSVTLFYDTGEYALLQIDKFIEGNKKPFFYHTAIGMILTGTCVSDSK